MTYIGQDVYCYRSRTERRPMSARITAVNEDGTVNLCVFEASGNTTGQQGVPHLGRDETPTNPYVSAFCTPMPKGESS